MRVTVRVDDAGLRAAMKDTRKELNRDVRSALIGAAEDVALPVAKRLAPHRTGELARSLTARGSARSAYLTTSLRGRKGRRVGLLEYGGTVPGKRSRVRVIEPRKAKALRMPDGRFIARMSTPRTYPAQRFMQRSVETQRVEIEEAIVDSVSAAVIRHLERNGLGAA